MSTLPDKVLLQVFRHLDMWKLLEVRAVCRRWRVAALHPDLWGCFRTDLDGRTPKKTFVTLLRLAPCINSLFLSSWFAFQGDYGELLATTCCAVNHLYICTSNAKDVVVAIRILRNQVALGRLKKLTISSGKEHLLNAAISSEGLHELELDSGCAEPTGSSASTLPNHLTRPSLKKLVYSGVYPCFEFLVRSHASTLKAIEISPKLNLPLSCLIDVPHLRELRCSTLKDLPLLVTSKSLTSLTLDVTSTSDEENFIAAEAFLRAAPNLKRVVFYQFYFFIEDEKPEDSASLAKLVRALAASGRAKVEEMIFEKENDDDWSVTDRVRCYDRFLPYLQDLAAALPRLPYLTTLDLGGCVSADFLAAISPTTAPMLTRLYLYANGKDSFCSHEWIHREEVQQLFIRNRHLHVLTVIWCKYCSICNVCQRGCHALPVKWEERRKRFVGFFGHRETVCCNVHATQKDIIWVKV